MVGSPHAQSARLVTALPRSSWPPLERTRQRYAVLVDSLDDEHELAVIQGALAAARELDARLFIVPGGTVDASEIRRRTNNFAFDLVGTSNALGVLVLSSALGNEIGPAKLASWLQRFSGVPVCCMGVPIEGHVSVRVDNASGIREVVHHLVEVHGKRNLGFVRGPAHSDEAEVRLSAYRDALQAHDITPDPRWIAEGDYNRASGAQAVRTIFDQRRVSLQSVDALVCANDYMALGALEELGRRGVNVPEQIAVSGFDDVDSAQGSRPTLTTVRQPASELGREGLKQLLALSGGMSPGHDCVLPVELKLRRSCGCSSLDVTLRERVSSSGLPSSFEVALIQRRQLIIAELARAAHGSFGAGGPDWESALLGALLEEVREAKPGALSRRVQRLLQKLEHGGSDLSAAPLVLATLRRQALPCIANQSKERDGLEDAIADAQLVTTGMLKQVAGSTVRASLRRTRALARAVQEQMFGKPAAVSRVLAEQLPPLGIDACVVAAIAEESERGLVGEVCLGFAPGKGHPESEGVLLSRLIEHPLVEQGRALFLLPIALGDEPLGVAAFSVTTQLTHGELLEDLRELLAPVLKVVRRRHA
jgi:DNA-binding LacI/PurR family transcriptional regulator